MSGLLDRKEHGKCCLMKSKRLSNGHLEVWWRVKELLWAPAVWASNRGDDVASVILEQSSSFHRDCNRPLRVVCFLESIRKHVSWEQNNGKSLKGQREETLPGGLDFQCLLVLPGGAARPIYWRSLVAQPARCVHYFELLSPHL